MDYGFHPDAALELEAAMAHYVALRADLARKFLGAVGRAVSLIRTHPNASPKVSRRSRRCRTRRFPYGLVYQVRGGEIVIIAVMHLSGAPDTGETGRSDPPTHENQLAIDQVAIYQIQAAQAMFACAAC